MALALDLQLPAKPDRPSARRTGVSWRLLALCVGLPTIAAAIYYGLIASEVYVSAAKFMIRGDQPLASSGLELALFGAGGGDDSLIVREYILSHGIVDRLEEQIGLRRVYSADDIDPLQRLSVEASNEELAAYFEDMIEVQFDPESSVTTLRVRAFSPDDAQAIAQAIMALSESLVNGLSERVTDDLLSFSRAELARAESRIATARRAITAFRDRTAALDPGREAGAILGIIGELETKLAQERAALSELRSYMREDSARITGLKARITALSAQVEQERARLTGSANGRLSEVVSNYEELQLELEFAQSAYTHVLSSLETARAEAQKQQKYLIRVVPPNLPDEALEPDRALSVLAVFLGALLTYAIGALLIAAVREHAEV